MVSLGISPVVISLTMVLGVFLARWSLPALLRGMSAVRADVRQAPHLVVWAALAGCLWAVANTLTIFAIRDIGLDRKSTRLNSSHGYISYAVFCLKKKKRQPYRTRAGSGILTPSWPAVARLRA